MSAKLCQVKEIRKLSAFALLLTKVVIKYSSRVEGFLQDFTLKYHQHKEYMAIFHVERAKLTIMQEEQKVK